MSTQITEMFKDSNRRMKRIMSGNFKLDEVSAAQREFEGQIKLINSIVSAYGISSKNKRALSGLEKMNLMDDSTAIDLGLGDPELDKVKCPNDGQLITRADCLGYSGTSENIEDCKSCQNFATTRKLLLPGS